LKNKIKKNFPKLFFLLRFFYHTLVLTPFLAIRYIYMKYICREELYNPSIEKYRDTWQEQLKLKKNDSYTNWREEKHTKDQKLDEIRKTLQSKSKEFHSILEIGSYDGYFIKDYFDFKKIICADVFKESGEFILEHFPNHRDITFVLLNGENLNNIPNDSVDFIYSMDSLTRVPVKVIENYLIDFGKVVRDKGEIFVHVPKFNFNNKLNGHTTLRKARMSSLLQDNFESISFVDDLDLMGTFISAKKINS